MVDGLADRQIGRYVGVLLHEFHAVRA
ncbi:hypothetical protein ACWFR1_07030 [Streptomyces sp. NPDC055103]